jgi:hypothetical protein
MGYRHLPTPESFRVPNSLIQGLTTVTPANLHHLSPFTITTLLGLLTLVPPNHPEREVFARPSDILEIIQVGRQVAHAVDREWENRDGKRRCQRYAAKRFNPKQMAQIQEALLDLHSRTVLVHRPAAAGVTRADLFVHVLDMFGYVYRKNGRDIDIHQLPEGVCRVNVGTDERPVWRLRRCGDDVDRDERAAGIVFRLNQELAGELQNAQGTIGFTLIAQRVFGVLLVLRQTSPEFSRHLGKLLEDLGWEPDHPSRARDKLHQSLERLRGLEVVQDFHIEPEHDRLKVVRNLDWHKGPLSVPHSRKA